MKCQIKRVNKHFELEELPDDQFYIDILNEQTPCDGCVHAQKCGQQKLACYAFALYVNDGEVDWTVKRAPTKRLYARVMRLGDKGNSGSLMREINKYRKEREKACV